MTEAPRTTYAAAWPAIVTDAEHYAAVRVLADPGRSAHVVSRPGKQVHLLTYLATCGVCGAGVRAQASAYACAQGHVHTARGPVDEYVRNLVLAYLSREDVYAQLRQAGDGGDAEVVAARDEVARLRERLDEWRASAAVGVTSPHSLAVIEARITKEITTAERRATTAGIPAALRMVLAPGEDVEQRWTLAPVAAKRTILAMLMNIRLVPSGHNRYAPIEQRVIVTPR